MQPVIHFVYVLVQTTPLLRAQPIYNYVFMMFCHIGDTLVHPIFILHSPHHLAHGHNLDPSSPLGLHDPLHASSIHIPHQPPHFASFSVPRQIFTPIVAHDGPSRHIPRHTRCNKIWVDRFLRLLCTYSRLTHRATVKLTFCLSLWQQTTNLYITSATTCLIATLVLGTVETIFWPRLWYNAPHTSLALPLGSFR